MSISISNHHDQLTSSIEQSGVRRTAFYLTSRNEPLFAWLHRAQSQRAMDHAVVICPPIGCEQLHSHRALRQLADALAARAIPAVRFDWHGTGDSAGSDGEPARQLTWRTNVRDVIAWIRTHLGCQSISVVGLRMGAMLAVESLGYDECDNLVLWAPVVSGQAYVRQAMAIDKMAVSRPPSHGLATGDIEAAGFLLSEETIAGVAQCNLLECPLTCRRVLLVGPYDKRLPERFASLDIPVSHVSPPGFNEMMAEPHLSQVPEQAILEIINWLGQHIAAESEVQSTVDVSERAPQRSLMSASKVCAQPASDSGRWHEQIVRIGGNVEIFGIVSEPESPTADLPAVILLNVGAANRTGPGRINVELARRLAANGFRCLRIDECGLGDSPTKVRADDNHPYPTTMFRDILLALNALQRQYEVSRCVALGLCSGAYAAFQSAAQLDHPLLVESVLINPLTFYWKDGMPLDPAVAMRQFQQMSPGEPMTGWRKCAREALTDCFQFARKAIARGVPSVVSPDRQRPVGFVSHPSEMDLSADLARVAARRRKLTMFLAENEPGYDLMLHHAKKVTSQLLATGDLRISQIAGADHTFSRRRPRRELIEAVVEHLRSRYGEPIATRR
jgi:pimeloyl-ACP methyl ester carboxylesterase